MKMNSASLCNTGIAEIDIAKNNNKLEARFLDYKPKQLTLCSYLFTEVSYCNEDILICQDNERAKWSTESQSGSQRRPGYTYTTDKG